MCSFRLIEDKPARTNKFKVGVADLYRGEVLPNNEVAFGIEGRLHLLCHLKLAAVREIFKTK